ncbi:hypothetical protein PspLS_11850, partial [Pyricularia sp. CBS 133598]
PSNPLQLEPETGAPTGLTSAYNITDIYRNLPTILAPTNPTVPPITSILKMQMQDEKPLQTQSTPISGMTMVFFSSQSTSLFSRAWTPSSPEAYVGTCIFVFLLTIMQYLLIAVRNVVFEKVEGQTTATSANPFQEHRTKPAAPAKDEEESSCLRRHGTATGRLLPVFDSVAEQQRRRSTTMIVTARATCEVVISATGYLVHKLTMGTSAHLRMLAAMTMNVGYFLSVIAGVFFGSLLFGRFGVNDISSCHH